MSFADRLPGSVRIVEVAPRDGLQNERRRVPTEQKIAFIEALIAAGHSHVEVTSMVRPDRVPQLADAEDVLAGLSSRGADSAILTVLVPNHRGLERALRAGVRSIAVFTAASETFSQRNTGSTVAESLKTIESVASAARSEGLRVRGYVSTAFVCPYEGRIPPERTAGIVGALRAMGIESISIGDTIGAATPRDVDQLLTHIESTSQPSRGQGFADLALHLHDTHGRALANAVVGLERGIAELDSSAAGLGGCPFAPGAKGNVDTRLLVSLLHDMGIATGIDLEAHDRAAKLIRDALSPGERGAG